MKCRHKQGFDIYMFEPTNQCNLNCPLCPTGNKSCRRPAGFMDPALFEKAMEIERINNRRIWLWGWGEPLLHAGLSQMVAAAKKRNNTIEIQSNGTASYESYRPLIEAGLDILTISMDGMSDEAVRPMRGNNISIAKVKSRIVQLADLCSSSGHDTSLNVQCIATRYNEGEIETVRQWVLDNVGSDAFSLKTLCIGEITQGKASKYLPKNQWLTRYVLNDRGNVSIPTKSGVHCGFLSNIRVFLWDFTIVPCCYDYQGEYTFGNIFTEWNDQEFKEKYLDRKVSMCDICPEMSEKATFV